MSAEKIQVWRIGRYNTALQALPTIWPELQFTQIGRTTVGGEQEKKPVVHSENQSRIPLTNSSNSNKIRYAHLGQCGREGNCAGLALFPGVLNLDSRVPFTSMEGISPYI